MNGDKLIRKQVGRPRAERPLVRLDRLNRGLRNLGLMPPHESNTDHVRKTVGRVGTTWPASASPTSGRMV